ncbi:GNAT family N-acetyltransferase [Corynebacterium tapiri]|uniref:N-acetyltransferase family protein n=1 Tax=Corynebacterium tapiri TaxID=1448266 RepID=A0A5C4U7J2_9CORY|nr:GNAT family N-acetyltransferase [Corynebacterium tapiri]TNM00443.1 N-acetyltransferase family protein [Corynebacterium tapiri]
MQIREATEADVPNLTDINTWAVEETVATFVEVAPTEAERAEWMRERQSRGWPVLVAYEGEEFLGYASYGEFRPASGYRHTLEHSIYVSPSTHGKGVGTALMRALIDAAQADPEVWDLIATVEGSNEASLRMHEKLGFVERGRLPGVGFKFGRRLDLVYLQLSTENT